MSEASVPATREMHPRCPIEKLRVWKDQPRSNAAASEGLDELASSIQATGVIEPLVVRRTGFDEFEILAGERRWRAAQRAGLLEVPIVVRECLTDADALTIALTENTARENLSFADFAHSVQRLRDMTGATLEEVGKRIGCSTTYVSQCQVVAAMPEEVLQLNRDGHLGTAALLHLRHVKTPTACIELAQRAVRESLPVAEVKKLVDSAKESRRVRPGQNTPRGHKSAGVRDLEMRFARRLGLRCDIAHERKGFKLTLVGTLDQLDQLVEQLEI
jgi:ParB family chromosome partitioning protein